MAHDVEAADGRDTRQEGNALMARRPEQIPLSRPTLVIVSGRPGSGKTTMARLLADALSCPLVSRDEINEGIFHTFQHDLSIAAKEAVATMAYHAFFNTIGLLLSSQVSVVAEAAFQDHKWRQGLATLTVDAEIKIIHCMIDPASARQRVLARRQSQDTPSTRRAAQGRTNSQNWPDQGFDAISLPAPTLTVTTVKGYAPSLEKILTFIRSPAG